MFGVIVAINMALLTELASKLCDTANGRQSEKLRQERHVYSHARCADRQAPLGAAWNGDWAWCASVKR